MFYCVIVFPLTPSLSSPIKYLLIFMHPWFYFLSLCLVFLFFFFSMFILHENQQTQQISKYIPIQPQVSHSICSFFPFVLEISLYSSFIVLTSLGYCKFSFFLFLSFVIDISVFQLFPFQLCSLPDSNPPGFVREVGQCEPPWCIRPQIFVPETHI